MQSSSLGDLIVVKNIQATFQRNLLKYNDLFYLTPSFFLRNNLAESLELGLASVFIWRTVGAVSKWLSKSEVKMFLNQNQKFVQPG
jgi:hypothetical protein